MADASVIITYRDDATGHRRRNLNAVLASYARVPQLEAIVVEQDHISRLSGHPLPANARLIFGYNPGPFNKSWGYNLGLRAAQSSVWLFADADMVLPKGLDATLTAFQRGAQLVKPYGKLYDLSEAQTVVAISENRFVPGPPDQAPNREGVGEFIVLAGGIIGLRREALVRLGGWDERYHGWGGEDDAMSYLVERARLPSIELKDDIALHLWHPRIPETTTGQPEYATNQAILAETRLLADASLQRFAEVQLQIMGLHSKYQPRPE